MTGRFVLRVRVEKTPVLLALHGAEGLWLGLGLFHTVDEEFHGADPRRIDCPTPESNRLCDSRIITPDPKCDRGSPPSQYGGAAWR